MPEAQFHALPGLGVISLQGPDATSFLQGQVTADLRLLEPGHSVPAAWCSPQGRVIALLHVARNASGLACVLPRELAADVASRLARFVLRAKVTVSDESAAVAAAGVTGSPAAGDGVTVIPLREGRSVLVGAPDRLESACAQLPRAPATAWEAACIRLGEPEVYASTSEAWVPQMLNLDLLGAVSFRKGCYPGQEVVARTQNLGRIKRRLFRYRVSGEVLPVPGDALCLGQAKVGEVVRSARHDDVAELLAVVNLDSAGMGLTAADGTMDCSPEPLPYPVPEAPEGP